MDFVDLAARHGTSLAIGLLIGLERERHPLARAGVRTFALIALAGSLAAMVANAGETGWIVVVGLAVVATALIGAYLADPASAADDFGTTTVVTALVTYLLGVAVWHGFAGIAAAIAIVVTALLHFKPELEGFSRQLSPQDVRGTLQFAVLSFVVLPLVPDHGYGPYGALNPYNIWLMVVLVSGVSLAGYVGWRLLVDHQRVAVAGLVGGLVSTTATTLVYARAARRTPSMAATAATIVMLASLVIYARIAVMALLTAPDVAPRLYWMLGAGLLASMPATLGMWWRGRRGALGAGPDFTNPTNLMTAVGFGAAYGVVILASAWLSSIAGNRGLLLVALVSGLTDVDAITLSSLRLATTGAIRADDAVQAIALALVSNLAFKAGVAFVVGGAAVGSRCLLAFAPAAVAIGATALLLP